MSVTEEREFTQCGVDLHIKKTFSIGLPRPSEERLDDLRARYRLGKLALDDDGDLMGREGTIETDEGEARIREIGYLQSRDRASIICLGAPTSVAIATLEDVIQTAYAIPPSSVRAALDYLTYDTTTKVQFSAPLYGLFNAGIQQLFQQWGSVDSKRIVTSADLSQGDWPPTSEAMTHTTAEFWEKYFGKGAPDEALVVPLSLRFRVKVPTRFYRLLDYDIRIAVESTEDFLEHKYFVSTEFPHSAHMEFLKKLDSMLIPSGQE